MTEGRIDEIKELVDLLQNGTALELMEVCQRKIAEGSLNPYYFMVMGVISLFNGDAGLGLQLAERAHAIDPNCREVVDVLASLYTRVGRLTDGLFYAKLAVCLKPNPEAQPLVPPDLASYAASLVNVGVSHHLTNAEAALHLGLFDEARDQTEKYLRIHPEDGEGMVLAAKALLALQRPRAAAAMMRAALHHDPHNGWMHALLAEALMGCARHEAALPHQKLAFESAGDDDALKGRLAGGLALQSGACRPAAEDLLRALNDEREAPIRRVNVREPIESLMVGILWDQVYDSPLVHCVTPICRRFDMSVLYVRNVRHDAVGDALRGAVLRPRQAVGVDDATLGRIVVGDQVVALINLCAPSEIATFPVFKGEGAPMVVHWVTSPMCDRIPGADLVLADPETVDVDRRTYGEERVAQLSNLLAFEFPRILAPEEEVLDLPRETRGFAMFGVHGVSARMTPDSVALWSKVLWACPEAHLMIGGRDDWEEGMVTWALDAFAEYGVSTRIHFQAPLEGEGAFAAAKAFPHMVDVILDSTPVGAEVETVHDLWMGLPVVSLRGPTRVGRVGASVLRAAGRPEWIADDEAGYIRIAAALAHDPALGEIRKGLREQVLGSRLADPVALGNEIAQCLMQALTARRAQR